MSGLQSIPRVTIWVTVAAFCVFNADAVLAQTPFGPSPYLQFSDSPFSSIDFSSGYFHLEDFEDEELNTPGVTDSQGEVIGPDFQTDSVDADDGMIDGLGQLGHSWYLGDGELLEFFFDGSALGGLLPTHVGIVWTDVGFVQGEAFGFADVSFEAFDAGDNSLGVIGPDLLGDGSVEGGTAEDRFFGMFSSGGIARIAITTDNSSDWEIDHLQYGFVPEPASVVLVAIGTAWLARKRRGR